MGQQELFYETLTDALRATVDALGGPKVTGPILWPEKTVDEARRMLLDCLNPDRPHRLDPDKLVLLLSLGRGKGVHTAMAWILDACGYAAPTPVEPEDKDAELMREFIRAAQSVENIAKRMERTRIKSVG